MPPLRILPSDPAHPLHGIGATRAIEQRAQAGLAPHTLMQRAGHATARLALALAPHAGRVWIAAGPGNNGGDGLAAALHLAQAGKAVRVTLIADASRLPADAGQALSRARSAGVDIGTELPGAGFGGPDDLAIDALLGIGASRAPDGVLAAAIEPLNRCRGIVLAIDLPTGLHAGTGQPLGTPVVRATHTLALLTLKPGLYTGAGRDLAGEVWFDALGVAVDDTSVDETPDAWLAGAPPLARRDHALHKGSFGDVAIVGGDTGMVGAALLAARAAHAAGAGRVYVQALGTAPPGLDPLHPELMFRPGLLADPAHAAGLASIVCGCGGGTAVRAVLPAVLASAARLVLDADALNAIASDAALQAQLTARRARGRATVLTPHPLEAARLLGASTREVQADRLAAAQRLAGRYQCTVLLKGSGSIVAAPGRVPSINPTGNAALATAGTGDVLAGWLGGCWAALPQDAGFEAATQAAWGHGAAAPSAPRGPLRASDLIEAMAVGRQPR